jgi:hypothetical protein
LTAMDIGNRAGPERLPGASLPRAIAAGEKVEAELDVFISRRHDRRVKAEGERDEEAAWRESERRHTARRREANRLLWCDYFERLAASLRSRAKEYDQRAEMLMQTEQRKETA